MESAKRCTRCHVEKPLDAFYRSKVNKGGRRPWCAACHKAGNRAANERIRLEPSPERLAAAGKKLWDQVLRRGPDECWLWQGGYAKHSMARIIVNGKGYNPRRLLYLLDGEDAPDDLVPRATCRNPLCMNKRHLELRPTTNLAAERGVKYCSGCQKELPLERFTRDITTQSGLKAYCKQCTKDQIQRRLYGLEPGQYDTMKQMQDGKCAICGSAPSGMRSLAVDHDHRTGAVRALLCDQCNVGLGMFRSDIAILSEAARYVTRFTSVDESAPLPA